MTSKRILIEAFVLALQSQGLHAILRTSPDEEDVDNHLSKPRVTTEKTFGGSVRRILGGKGSGKMMGMGKSGHKGKGKGSDCT